MVANKPFCCSVECSRKKPKRCAKNWTKRKLKSTKNTVYPVRYGSCTGGDGSVAPDGVRAVPSGISYLGNKSKRSKEILSRRIPSGMGFAPDDVKVYTGRREWCPVRDKIN